MRSAYVMRKICAKRFLSKAPIRCSPLSMSPLEAHQQEHSLRLLLFISGFKKSAENLVFC